ncbi:MAG: hypothetical protein ABEK50_19140 [bacterium]
MIPNKTSDSVDLLTLFGDYRHNRSFERLLRPFEPTIITAPPKTRNLFDTHQPDCFIVTVPPAHLSTLRYLDHVQLLRELPDVQQESTSTILILPPESPPSRKVFKQQAIDELFEIPLDPTQLLTKIETTLEESQSIS